MCSPAHDGGYACVHVPVHALIHDGGHAYDNS